MVGLSQSNLKRFGYDYPGFICICKSRYGYGHQEYIEKLEILHSWYSDLNAYLPILFKGKEKEYTTEKKYSFEDKPEKLSLSDLMLLASDAIYKAYDSYDPLFEGQTCNPTEKEFIKRLMAIQEQLDIITAESKVIEGKKVDGEGFDV